MDGSARRILFRLRRYRSRSAGSSGIVSATLQSINSPGPVRIRERGTGQTGIDWALQPSDFARAVEMVNRCGGPGAWRITPLDEVDL